MRLIKLFFKCLFGESEYRKIYNLNIIGYSPTVHHASKKDAVYVLVSDGNVGRGTGIGC